MRLFDFVINPSLVELVAVENSYPWVASVYSNERYKIK